ncbi:MAG: pyridoxal phosphate-dependent aminotransferase [Candidatus Thorarchaeota archaeon]|jgi:aspartate aminotransferase
MTEDRTLFEIFQTARRLEREGKNLIHLAIGDPDFGPPKRVIDATIEALKNNRTKYTDSAGIPEFRQKIASVVGGKFNRDLSEDDVIVTVGARQAINLCIDHLVGPGDEVIVIAPVYPPYLFSVRDVGAEPVLLFTDLETQWDPDIDKLVEAINRKTKMIITITPNNPVGKTLDRNTMKQIAEVASDNDIFVLSDEVYSTLNYGTEFASILEFSECKYTYVGSFSKEFGMTGYRLGYVVTDTQNASNMAKRQRQSVISIPEFIQYAGIAALDCIDEANSYSKIVEGRLSTACKELERLPVSFYQPDGTFYVFPKIEMDMTGREFTMDLLSKKNVVVAPGDVFNLRYDKFFRMTVLQPEEKIVEAIDRMAEVLV